MTTEEAQALELFIKDHDTRFFAKTVDTDTGAEVQLTSQDGSPLGCINSIEEYGRRHIETKDPGPTIREAWGRWRQS